MKHAFQSWIEKRGRLPGILSCGVMLPDRTCLRQCNSKTPPEKDAEEPWHLIAEAVKGFSEYQIAPRRLLWTFAHGQLHCALRPDGVVFALVTPAQTGTYDPALIEKLIQEFMGIA